MTNEQNGVILTPLKLKLDPGIEFTNTDGSVRYEVIRKYDYFDMAKKAGVYDVLITRDDASDEEVKQAHETLIRFLHTAELIRPITIQE